MTLVILIFMLSKAHRINIVSVPYTPHGPDLEIFQFCLAEHSPRLYITNSGIHNPTGAVLSPVTAHRLLKLVDQTNLVIVEDDIFADFEHTPLPHDWLLLIWNQSVSIQVSSF